MLASSAPVSRTHDGQGCLRAALVDLQRQGADSVCGENGLRQRLNVLAERLARVQSQGGEYARVGFSEYVEEARRTPTV